MIKFRSAYFSKLASNYIITDEVLLYILLRSEYI